MNSGNTPESSETGPSPSNALSTKRHEAPFERALTRTRLLFSSSFVTCLLLVGCGGGGGGGGASVGSSSSGTSGGSGSGSGGSGSGPVTTGLATNEKYATLADMLADPNVKAAIAALPADGSGQNAGTYYQGSYPYDPSGQWTTNSPGSPGQYNNGSGFGATSLTYQVTGAGLIDISSGSDLLGTFNGTGSFFTGENNQITVFDQTTETCSSNGSVIRAARIERFTLTQGNPTTGLPDELTNYSASNVTLGLSCADSSCTCNVGGTTVGFPPVGTVSYTTTPAIFARIGTAPSPVVAQFSLTINGAGTGTVTSSPAGLSCTSSCTSNITVGNVTLTATPGAKSAFAGWQIGGEQGTGCGTGNTCTLAIASIGAGASASFTPTPRNSWITQAPMPTARYGLVAAFANGLIYAIGGANGAGTALATVEAYNPTTNTWNANLPAMPTARYGAAVAVANVLSQTYPPGPTISMIFVAGGYDANGNALSTVEAFNTSTHTWSSVGPLVNARGYFGLFPPTETATGDILLAIGGYNGAAAVNIVEQSPGLGITNSTASWGDVGGNVYSLPTPLWGFGAVQNSDSEGLGLYVFGGSSSAGSTNAVLAWNYNTNAWVSQATMPQAASFSAVAFDGTLLNVVYVLGGLTVSGAMQTVLNTAQIYNLGTNTWTSGPALPTARWNTGTAAVNGLVYVIGGDKGNSTPTNVVEMYQP